MGEKVCYTSDDGVKQSSAGKAFNAEPLAAGNGIFIGCSWKTSLYVSPDAISWKKTLAAGSNALNEAAFGVRARP